MNWGLGIALFYSAFALAMIAMVIRSTHYDHSLVRDDYYQGDLEYQAQYDKLVNAQAAELIRISHRAGTQEVVIIPAEELTGALDGKILFFRPNDQSKDFEVPLVLDPDSGVQHIDLGRALPGRWKLKVDYSVGETPYYQETEIIVTR